MLSSRLHAQHQRTIVGTAARSAPLLNGRRHMRATRHQVPCSSSSGQQEASAPDVCSTCGVARDLADKSCDGQGRIIGGMGAVPGFGWWPIKAYRPCPKLEEAGIEYVRKGQATNDVLFGGVSLGKEGVKTLEEMRRTAERGIKVE